MSSGRRGCGPGRDIVPMMLAGAKPACRRLRHFILAITGLLLGTTACWSATTLHGVVVRIRDGDTLQFQTDAGRRIEVRLNAIDAPERSSDGTPSQPFAQTSRIHLARLAARRRATFQHHTMDRYGRYVGVLGVETPEGIVDAGLWQVQAGMAWVYTRYLPELPARMRQRYRDAERIARTEGRGLWQDAHPVPPWEWRQRHQPPKRMPQRERSSPGAASGSYVVARAPAAVSACMVSRAKHRSAQDFALSGSVRSRYAG